MALLSPKSYKQSIVSWTLLVAVLLVIAYTFMDQIKTHYAYVYVEDSVSGGKVIPVVLHTANTVNMTAEGFEPARLTIATGSTVTFFNKDVEARWPAAGPHNYHDKQYSADGGVAPNGNVTLTFLKPGRWQYHDHLHYNNNKTFELIVLGDSKEIAKENNAVNPTPAPAPAPATKPVPAPAVKTLATRESCTTPDNHGEGMLTAQFDSAGKLTGWSCSITTHMMNCSAGPDGIWDTCDVNPKAMAWPNPVSKTALANPKLYVSN